VLFRPADRQIASTPAVEILDKEQVEKLFTTEIPPLNSDELNEANWKEFTPIEGGITVRLPGKPEVLDINIPNTTAHGYILSINDDISLTLTSFRFHVRKSSKDQESQYKSLEDSLLNSPSRPRKLIEKKDRSSNGIIEKELILKEEWIGGYSRVVIYVTEKHSHSVQYFGPKRELLDSAIANNYLASVELNIE